MHSTAPCLTWYVVIYTHTVRGKTKRKVIDAYTGHYADQNADNRLNEVVRRNLYPGEASVITLMQSHKPRVGALV